VSVAGCAIQGLSLTMPRTCPACLPACLPADIGQYDFLLQINTTVAYFKDVS
jgi:hypothetical protein